MKNRGVNLRVVAVAILLQTAMLALACGTDSPIAPDGDHRSLAISGGNPGPLVIPEETDLDGDGLGDTAEETLIRRYRPYFYFDGQEFIFPISINDWANLGGRDYIDFYTYYQYLTINGLYTAVSYAPNGLLSPDYITYGSRSNYGPLYVEAVPLPTSYTVDQRDSLVHLHFWLFFGRDIKYSNYELQHEGDWEHVCVLAERGAVNNANLPPVKIHWHHHDGVTVSSTAYAYHADSWGSKHPRAYVETGSHGIYRAPGTGGGGGPADDDAGSPVNPLSRPLRFMANHWMNRSSGSTEALEKDILQMFNGRWGGSGFPGSGPWNPLEYRPTQFHSSSCGHDYNANAQDFRGSSCVVWPWDDAH